MGREAKPRIRLFGPPTFHPFLLLDVPFWVAAVLFALVLRFEFNLTKVDFSVGVVAGLFVGIVHGIVGIIGGLYREKFVRGSLDEFVGLSAAAVIAAALLLPLNFFVGLDFGLPRSILVIALPFFLILSGFLRLTGRILSRAPSKSRGAQNALIYGAGDLAQLLVPQLLADPSAKYFPVGLLDDDPAKSGRWISGVRVKGGLENLAVVARKQDADVLIVAISSADSQMLEKLESMCFPLGISVVLLPTLSEMLEGAMQAVPLRELGIEELIGRRAVSIDSQSVKSYVTGSTVLVTGAGGSIGAELCKQVSRFEPKRIVFVDHDETGLQHVQLIVNKRGLMDSPDMFLVDIRDLASVEEIFRLVKPDVVFHAAALKHLPALEKFPREAWKTNVIGTLNVLRAAAESGVSRFVNISTDKAADPTSVLGLSKKIGEELTSWFSTNSDGLYHSVRFGNVAGSRGSLIPTFQTLLEQGLPLVITDPEATRYFMTIPEACQLVLQAGSEEGQNVILVLDMGAPVRILDIAQRMIEMSGKKVDITFSGLRKGEKLHEDLWARGENVRPSSHPLISRIDSPPTDPASLGDWTSYFLVKN